MPIDRPDGRHWCAPDAETPDEHGVWVCPGCKTSWTWVEPAMIVKTDEVAVYLAAKIPVAEPPKETE